MVCILIVFPLMMGLAMCMREKETRKEKFFASGQEYFNQGKYPEAIIQFKNVIQLDPKNANAYYQLGLTYLRLGKPNDAFTALGKSVELDPKLALAEVQLGNLYILSKKPEESKTMCREGLGSRSEIMEGLDPSWKCWH